MTTPADRARQVTADRAQAAVDRLTAGEHLAASAFVWRDEDGAVHTATREEMLARPIRNLGQVVSPGYESEADAPQFIGGNPTEGFEASCDCGWSQDGHPSAGAAESALNAHRHDAKPVVIACHKADGIVDLYAECEELAAERDAAVARAETAEAERGEISGRLSELLCNLTGGRLSKTNYSVRTMEQEIEEHLDARHSHL